MKVRANPVHASKRKGASVVEMALLLPFLLFLFVIAIDYARVFYYGTILENCSRNGAYYASNYPNSSYLYNDIYGYKTMDEAVYKDAENMMKPGDANNPKYKVEYSYTQDSGYSSTPLPSGYVRVTLTWNFKTITQYPFVPSTVNLSRSTIMRMAPSMPEFN